MTTSVSPLARKSNVWSGTPKATLAEPDSRPLVTVVVSVVASPAASVAASPCGSDPPADQVVEIKLPLILTPGVSLETLSELCTVSALANPVAPIISFNDSGTPDESVTRLNGSSTIGISAIEKSFGSLGLLDGALPEDPLSSAIRLSCNPPNSNKPSELCEPTCRIMPVFSLSRSARRCCWMNVSL